ncbi:EF-hand [Pluteus cervinus]|uniref:EF-hand n=1 Tax=Pluteus cervinus TaxID=181527 RepID=A0ACD3B2C6_9AGAR|nr:EF-hand [Pluteus cervinus]
MLSSDFTATDAEESLVLTILRHADPNNDGFLTGDAALAIFSKSNLPPETLHEIWDIADYEKTGQLSNQGLAIALRLMGWAQRDEPVSPALVNREGPLPILHDLDILDESASGLGDLSEEDARNYYEMFKDRKPVNGFLSAEKAQDAFMESGLPIDDLLRIWDLSDSENRGKLDCKGFAIGLHILKAYQAGSVPSIPLKVPLQIYDQIAQQMELVSSPPPPSPAPPPYSRPPRPPKPASLIAEGMMAGPSSRPSPTMRHSMVASLPSRSTVLLWDISNEEKAYADEQFDKLDVEKKGYLENEVVRRFILHSNPDLNDLTEMWSLADLDQNGLLTRNGFAIAVHLLSLKLGELPLPPPEVPPRSPTITKLAARNSILLKTRPPPPIPSKEGLSPTLSPKIFGKLPVPPPEPRVHPNGRLHRSVSEYQMPKPHRPRSSTGRAGGLVPKPSKLLKVPSQTLRQSNIGSASPPSPSPDTSAEHLATIERLQTSCIELQAKLISEQRTTQRLEHENSSFKTKLQDMEQSMSAVLSATSDASDRKTELLQELAQLKLKAEATDEVHVELIETKQLLQESMQVSQSLRLRLEDMDTTTAVSTTENDELKRQNEELNAEIDVLRMRVQEMERAFSRPTRENNERQMEVLMADVTRENESLKVKLREMTATLEQNTASPRDRARNRDLEDTNRRLTLRMQEHEIEAAAFRVERTSSEASTRENVLLKEQLRELQRKSEQDALKYRTKTQELTRQVEELRGESERLRELERMLGEARGETQRLAERMRTRPPRPPPPRGRPASPPSPSSSSRAQMQEEDMSLPPPAYEAIPIALA